MVTLEALGCRTPLVATTAYLEGGLLEHGHNCLISAPEAPRELSEQMNKMLSSPERAARLAERGYDDVLRKYAPGVVTERVSEIYSDLLDADRRAR